jgi:FixJ family two-component response regulator
MPEAQVSAGPQGSVYLVEDEAAVRRSLALLLRLHGYRTHEYASAEDYLSRAQPDERPACALVDIRLPGMSGLALQARLVRERRAPPVLLMTAQGDAALARTAFLQGASDFLEKPIDEQELLPALQAALQADAEQLASHQESERLLQGLAQLSARERALFDGITSGCSTRELAEQLGLPLLELDGQRLRLMEKLRVRRMAELFRLRFALDAYGAGA